MIHLWGPYSPNRVTTGKLMRHIKSMDAKALGTLIYYEQMSSKAKLFIGRLYYYSESQGGGYRKKHPDGVKFISACMLNQTLLNYSFY